jgi:hypothetical protein
MQVTDSKRAKRHAPPCALGFIEGGCETMFDQFHKANIDWTHFRTRRRADDSTPRLVQRSGHETFSMSPKQRRDSNGQQRSVTQSSRGAQYSRVTSFKIRAYAVNSLAHNERGKSQSKKSEKSVECTPVARILTSQRPVCISVLEYSGSFRSLLELALKQSFLH